MTQLSGSLCGHAGLVVGLALSDRVITPDKEKTFGKCFDFSPELCVKSSLCMNHSSRSQMGLSCYYRFLKALSLFFTFPSGPSHMAG